MNTTDLIALHKEPAINRISQFAELARRLEIGDLVQGYETLVRTAPARHERGKLYLSGRDGITNSGSISNRREEHLAVALYNAARAGSCLTIPDGRALEIIDYQTPLKARRCDAGVGKIDLFGALGETTPCVIELKVLGPGGGLTDTPLRALLEGLAYCAIVEANVHEIAAEAEQTYRIPMRQERPALAVMAPDDYWLAFLNNSAAGSWHGALQGLITGISLALDMEVHLLALRDGTFEMGLEGRTACVTRPYRIETVERLISGL